MKIDIAKDGTVSREVVWLTAWCMVATSDSCVDTASPARWADCCLDDFDKRFPGRLVTDAEAK